MLAAAQSRFDLQAALPQKAPKHCFNGVLRRSLSAPHAEHNRVRHERQHRLLLPDTHRYIGRKVFGLCDTRRTCSVYWIRTVDAHTAARQQFAGNMLNMHRISDAKVLAFCPFIHGKHAVYIGCGRDDCLCATHLADCTCKPICTAQVTGKQRNRQSEHIRPQRPPPDLSTFFRYKAQWRVRQCPPRPQIRVRLLRQNAFSSSPTANRAFRTASHCRPMSAPKNRQAQNLFGKGQKRKLHLFHRQSFCVVCDFPGKYDGFSPGNGIIAA